MASSDTDDDTIISSALLIASTLYQQLLTQINNWHVNKQLTSHSSATEQEIAEE